MLSQSTGAYVTLVVEGGPADQALEFRGGTQITEVEGILAGGDLIIAATGRTINVFSELLSYMLLNKKPGDQIQLTILRNGEQKEVTVTLDKRPNTFRNTVYNLIYYRRRSACITENDLRELVDMKVDGPGVKYYLNTGPAEGSMDDARVRLRNLLKQVSIQAVAAVIEQFMEVDYDRTGRGLGDFFERSAGSLPSLPFAGRADPRSGLCQRSTGGETAGDSAGCLWRVWGGADG